MGFSWWNWQKLPYWQCGNAPEQKKRFLLKGRRSVTLAGKPIPRVFISIAGGLHKKTWKSLPIVPKSKRLLENFWRLSLFWLPEECTKAISTDNKYDISCVCDIKLFDTWRWERWCKSNSGKIYSRWSTPSHSDVTSSFYRHRNGTITLL